MKPGIPWSVKGIEGKAREVAKDAARAEGMTLGEWLNHKILESAADDAALKARATRKKSKSSVSTARDSSPRASKPAATVRSQASKTEPAGNGNSGTDRDVLLKLDILADRLNDMQVQEHAQVSRNSMQSHMQPLDGEAGAAAMERLLERIEKGEQLAGKSITEIGLKVDKIGQRVEQVAARPFDLKAREVPGFSALEGAVRNIVDHIEKSEKQSRDVIGQLHSRIADLDGKFSTPADETSRPQAMVDLEERMQELAARVEEAAASKETQPLKSMFEARIRELAERIDTVRHSAEAIGQKAEASASKAMHEQADALERRISALIEQAEAKLQETGPKDEGLAAIHQEITSLHSRFEEIRLQSASEQEVQDLRYALEKLSSKVEENPVEGPIAQIEQRIAELSEQLQQVTQDTDYQPKLGALEARILELDNQIAATPEAPGSNIDSHVSMLEERISATEKQLGSLTTIENSIQQLFASLEESRAEARTIIEKASTRDTSQPAEPSAELKALQDGLAAVQANVEVADQRTQETLEAVHETLAQIISKLGDLDSGKAPDAGADITSQQLADVAQAAAAAQAALEAGSSAPEHTVEEAPQKVAPASDEAFSPFEDPSAAQSSSHLAGAEHTISAEPEPAAQEDWLSAVRNHMRQNHGIDAAAMSRNPNVPASAGIGSSHVDFIAAARRAASSAGPNGPAGGVHNINVAELGNVSFSADGDAKQQGRFASLLSKKTTSTQQGKKDSEQSSSRKRLLLAGMVLLAAVSAYSLNSGMFAPKPQKQSSIEVPTASQVAPAAEVAALAQPDTKTDQIAGIQLPATGAAIEVPAAGSRSDLSQGDPITTASVPAANASDPLLSQPNNLAEQSLSAVTSPAIAQAAELPDAIGTEELRQAAIAGDTSAQFVIASRFLEGRIVERNHEEAAKWYTQAANGGLAAAQYRVGTLYERGSGVKQDRFQAMSWYAKAAVQGNVKSMHNLAVMSADTTQGKPDMARAAKWFTAAASHGLPDSQYNLAVLYERGLGVQKNANEAFKWYSLAAKRGDRDAITKSNELKKQIDTTTLAQLEQIVAAWQPEAPKRESNMVSISNPAWGIETASNTAPAASQQTAAPALQAVTPPATPIGAKDQIKLAQQLLSQKGFDAGSPDGQMGSRTANAIRLYQLRNGLPVNGSVTKQLLDHLQQGLI